MSVKALKEASEDGSISSSNDVYNKASDCYEVFEVDKWQQGMFVVEHDKAALESPIALVYNGISHVVMMATPCDLEALALGFSLSEGIIDTVNQFYGVDIDVKPDGIELNIEISTEKFVQLKHWRRNQTGRTGCGLCGAESLKQAIRAVPEVPKVEPIQAQDLQKAITYLNQQQLLQQQTGASHCAAWYEIQSERLFLFEDVGRHNALDKLIGYLYQQKQSLEDGLALVSSRASYEMVTKACHVGISRLAAVSAPTSLAVNLARKSGLRLAGFVRPGRLNMYN
jgi:FdhD protein